MAETGSDVRGRSRGGGHAARRSCRTSRPAVALLLTAGVAAVCIGCASSPHTVDPGKLYRSGQLSSEDLAKACEQHGIKTIINLRTSKSSVQRAKRLLGPNGVWVVHIPMSPNTPPDADELNEFFSIMDDPSHHPVLIHCAHGRDRTGVMVAMYRIRYQNWPPKKAYAEMESLGHNTFLFGDLKPFVLGMGQALHGAPVADPHPPPGATRTRATVSPGRPTTRPAARRATPPSPDREAPDWAPAE